MNREERLENAIEVAESKTTQLCQEFLNFMDDDCIWDVDGLNEFEVVKMVRGYFRQLCEKYKIEITATDCQIQEETKCP